MDGGPGRAWRGDARSRRGGRAVSARSGSRFARGLPRDACSSLCRRTDGPGDRRKNRAEARLGAREPVSRHAPAAGKARKRISGCGNRKNDLWNDEMKNDYLWDRSGAPDRELEKLERVLGQFRSDAEAPAFPPLDRD